MIQRTPEPWVMLLITIFCSMAIVACAWVLANVVLAAHAIFDFLGTI